MGLMDRRVYTRTGARNHAVAHRAGLGRVRVFVSAGRRSWRYTCGVGKGNGRAGVFFQRTPRASVSRSQPALIGGWGIYYSPRAHARVGLAAKENFGVGIFHHTRTRFCNSTRMFRMSVQNPP